MEKNENELEDIRKASINFAIWLQDNYSQTRTSDNRKNNNMLPKGFMRKDFTDDIYSISDIWKEYDSRPWINKFSEIEKIDEINLVD